MICILYINLLGTLQFAGLYINAVTYICLVISIGLLVDFIVHVLLGYYESKELSREDKVKDTLETMGASIMLGGLTSFIGVIPLAFSTSEIMSTVFTAFLAMVILGVTHGIIFLPVLLSIFGPVNGGHLHDSSANELPEQAVNDNDDHDLCLEKEQEQSASDTDDSAGSVEKSQVDDHDIQRAIQSSSHPTTQPLHSTQTFREESLEVVLED